MNIYLIRHGETDWNGKFLFQGHADTPLNAAGKRQAAAIGKWLADAGIEHIITSDLKRAYETADIINSRLTVKVAVEKVKNFRERNYGNLEGKRYDLYHSQRRGFTGEKDGPFFRRINGAFNKVMKKFKGKNIAIVTHGGVVRQIAANAIGLKDYKKLRIYNGSISELFYNPEKKAMFLLLLNSVAHLPKKERNAIGYHIKGV